MYGVEAAVILLVCLTSLVALWTAPLWMRALGALALRLNRRLDRSGAAIEKFLGANSNESAGKTRDSDRERADIFPKEEL